MENEINGMNLPFCKRMGSVNLKAFSAKANIAAEAETMTVNRIDYGLQTLCIVAYVAAGDAITDMLLRNHKSMLLWTTGAILTNEVFTLEVTCKIELLLHVNFGALAQVTWSGLLTDVFLGSAQ